MLGVSAWIEGLSPEFIEKAKEELGETLEVKQQAIKELRKLLNEEADFHPQIDDVFLVRFLRAKKYDVMRTFKTLRHYYVFQAKYKGLMTGFSPKEVRPILEMNNIFVLPYRHPSGAAVGVVRLGCFDIDKVREEEIFATMMTSVEVVIEPEVTQVCGYIFIIDLSKFNLRMANHYAKPNLLYRIVRVVQDCIPYRMKAIHVIHEPYYFSIIYRLVKPLLSEKLTKRFHFHRNNLKSLHQHIPPEILPTEYGGEGGSALNFAKEYNARILSRESMFEKTKQYGFHDKKVHYFKKQDSRTLFH